MTALIILIVWVITKYGRYCPDNRIIENISNSITLKLEKIFKFLHPDHIKCLVLFIILLLFSILLHALSQPHAQRHNFLIMFISILVLWYGWSYQENSKIMPVSFIDQQADIFISPLNEQFTVLFWFVLLGPMGVLLTDFSRRMNILALTKLLIFPASRVLALGYALAGHFQPVFAYGMKQVVLLPEFTAHYIKTCGEYALYGNQESLTSITIGPVNLQQARALVKRAQFMLYLGLVLFSSGSLI